jgi:tetratricopeptide (TPR) repeat protein
MPVPNIRDIHSRIRGSASEEAEMRALEKEFRSYEDEDDRDEALYNLAEYLIEAGALDRAEEIARSLQIWIIEKTWLYGKIARQFASIGRRGDALRLLEEATPIARSEGCEWQRAESLDRIAKVLVALGERAAGLCLLEEGIVIARIGENKNDLDASSVLTEIAEDLGLAGEFERADAVAQAIKNEYLRKRTLDRVGRMNSLPGSEPAA